MICFKTQELLSKYTILPVSTAFTNKKSGSELMLMGRATAVTENARSEGTKI